MNNEAGKDEIFQEVYSSNIDLLVRIIRRITGSESAAEDVCQEAMVRYYDRIGKVPTGIEARYWLIRVAKNLAFNYTKRKERERKAYQKYLDNPDMQEYTDGDKELLQDETKKLVQQALDKLPEKLRMVLILKEYSEMNYKEIGKALNISESNVKVRVFRARQQLAGLLKKDELYVP